MNAVGKLEVGTLDITEYSSRVPAMWTLEARFVVRERDDYKRWHGEQLAELRLAWDEIHTKRRELLDANIKINGLRIICSVLAAGYLAIFLNQFWS